MEELLSRQTPHSLEAEQAVLGSMLIDPACVPDVVEKLMPNDFYIELHRLVYETIMHMFQSGRAIDPVTVLDEMKAAGHKDRADRTFFMQLIEITPTATNVGVYADIVRGKAMLRELETASSEIIELTRQEQEDPQVVAELAEQKIYAVRQGREVRGLMPVETAVMQMLNHLDELAKHPGQLPGLPTGLRELDEAIGGLNKSDLILLASRPGMGKTSLILNIAMAAAKAMNEKKSNPQETKTGPQAVVIFQLEMSGQQLATRLMSNLARVDSKRLRLGDLQDDDWASLISNVPKLNALDIYIDDNPSITPYEMKAKCRRLGDKLGLIVVDYLQLMQTGKRSDNRVQEVGEISRALKVMAKELNVPVLCCAQLRRLPEDRKGQRPRLSDLRESGAIEQDADIVMFINREEYYDENTANKNAAELIIAKNRHGETRTIQLQWAGQYTTFTSVETRHEAPPA